MSMTDEQIKAISLQRIALQATFKAHTDEHGFSYEEWINPPAGSFYVTYKKELADINNQMAPPLNYQS